MPVDIGPKIGIDGEKEFRQNLNNINQQLRTLGSEMKAVTSAFADGDDAQDNYAQQAQVLNKQIDVQGRKLEELEKGLNASIEKYGEADIKTLRWRQAVNDATAELNKMRSQLKKTEDAMEGLNDETDDSVDLFDKLDDALGTTGLGKTLATGLGVGAVVGGVKELSSALIGVVQDTQEYRTIMASLEVSSQNAGYTAEQTAETYERLQSVLGDTQTAATATANLQALGLGQANLLKLTDAAIGAWATYGDSIPIDGLAEAINETIQAGQVTGSFADVLNWAGGVLEDDFNAQLAECETYGDRVNLVLKALTDEGLAEAGQAWIDQNKDIVDMNKSTGEMEQAMADLGEVLAPVASTLQSFGADVINGVVIPAVQGAIDKITEFNQKMRDMREASKEAGTSFAGQGFNFDFVDTAANQQLAAPVNRKNEELLTSAMKAVGAAANNSAQVLSAFGANSSGGGQDVIVPITLEIDGDVLARKQITRTARQQTFAGSSLID